MKGRGIARGKKRFVGLLFFMFLLLVLAGCGGKREATKLTVYGFQAGAADSFLLTTANASLLIDCGEADDGEAIVTYLKAHGIDKLDYLVVTHFDKDHVGGAADVLGAIKVERVLQSNHPKDAEAYYSYVEALAEAGIEAETVTKELSFTLDGVQYKVNPPAGGYEHDKSNNSSLILSAVNGDDRLLFMGDAEDERIAEFLTLGWGTFDFLKVPHHGREGELSTKLFESVRPKIAIITSSEDEPEDEEVVTALKDVGAEVYLTRERAVVIESEGAGVRVRTGI